MSLNRKTSPFTLTVTNNTDAAPLTGVLCFSGGTQPVERIVLHARCGGEGFERSFLRPEPDRPLPVVGFRFGRQYRIETRVEFTLGESLTFESELTLPPPPDDPDAFPAIQIRASGGAEPGWVLLNPRRQIPTAAREQERTTIDPAALNYGLLLLLDETGEVVWCYRCGSRLTHCLVKGDRIYYGTADNRICEINFLGELTGCWCPRHRPSGRPVPKGAVPVEAETFHHQFLLWENGNFLALSTQVRRVPGFYTSEEDPDAPRATQWVVGDVVLEFQRDGQVVWEWNAFEHLDLERIGYETFFKYWGRRGYDPEARDWTHFNGLWDLPEENAILVNSRVQSAVFKIDRSTGDIRWIFGDGKGWRSPWKGKLFTLQEGVWPWQQHAPSVTPQGWLLLFNNDNYKAWPFSPMAAPSQTNSRPVAYALDEATMTARQVWDGTPEGENAVCSTAMGSAEPLPGGNVLANYGMLLDNARIDQITWETRERFPTWTMVRELTGEQPARTALEIRLLPQQNSLVGWQSFGAVKVTSLPGKID